MPDIDLCFIRRYLSYQRLNTTDAQEGSSSSSSSSHQTPQPPSNIIAMAPPPPHPMTMLSLSSPLAAQHERLILELLPFKDSNKFQEWLHGGFVRGSWQEFYRDFLSKTPHAKAPEPEKNKTAQAAKDAINSRSQKFMLYHPDKTNWSPDDHHIRFIVTVVQDNMLNSLWSESDWKKRAIEVTKSVYEVLCYLKATYTYAEANPPSYSQ